MASSSPGTSCTILAAGLALVAFVSCADAKVPAAEACAPLQTPEPNAPDQRPAFAGQTRACADRSNVAFEVVVLAKGLQQPWAVEPLPNGEHRFEVRVRIDTPKEREYFQHGGILHYVVRQLAGASKAA